MESTEKKDILLLLGMTSLVWINATLIYWFYPIFHAWALLAIIPIIGSIAGMVYFSRRVSYRLVDHGIFIDNTLLPFKNIKNIVVGTHTIEILSHQGSLHISPEGLQMFGFELQQRYIKSQSQ